MNAKSNSRAFPRHACLAWMAVLLALLTGYTACGAQPQASANPPVQAATDPTPKTSGDALRHYTLNIDGQSLQLDVQSLDIDAQTIEGGPKAQTFRGKVRVQLQLARSPVAPSLPADTTGTVRLLLQADSVELTQPPLHITVQPGSRCSVTVQDQSGRQLWKAEGTKCSLLDQAH